VLPLCLTGSFVYSIFGKRELVAVIASYLIKAKSKNGVPDILESHPRNTGEDGAPFVLQSNTKTETGRMATRPGIESVFHSK